MKKKYGLILISAVSATVLLFSCSKAETEVLNETPSSEDPTVDPQTELVTITAYLPEEDLSKVSITESDEHNTAILAWEASDQITIVSTGTEVTTTFGISEISGDGKKATFTGVAPAGTAPYTIFHHRSKPLTLDKFNSISYDGQLQDGNGSTDHLQYGMKLSWVNEYQSLTFTQEWATANSESGTGTLTQNSVLQLLLKLPDGVANVYSIYVHDDGSFKQTLWLKDGANLYASPTAGHIIKAYMMVPEMTLADGNLTVRVETEDGAYEGSYALTVTDWTGGSQYTVKKNMSALSAVTGEHAAMEIHAKCAQDILLFRAGVNADISRFKGSNVLVENNIDMASAGTWSTSIDGFTGTFDGQNKTISNLTATVPVFTAIPTEATVKNYTLNGAFTYTQPASGDNFGTLAKQLQGNLSNVIVNANITIGKASRSNYFDLGGLVGRANNVSASISDCQYNGNLVVPSNYTNTSSLRLGGLVGYTTKALTISNSSFGGTIKCLGHSTKEYVESEPGLEIGGIVGRNQKGIISDCSTTDSDSKVSVTIDKTAHHATILVQSSSSIFVSVGGIVGFNYDGGQVKSSCTNRASIFDNITTAASTLDVGGIAGINSNSTSSASVSDATNYASLSHLSTSPTQHLGGVTGYETGNSSNCTNESTGGVTVSGAAQQPMVGGVIGEKANGTITGTISNKGNVTINALTAGDYGCRLGGVVGSTSVALDGGLSKTVSNIGTIRVNADVVTSGIACLGGVVGYSSANISNVSNGGGLEFNGKYVSSPSADATSNVSVGGILGLTESSITVTKCTNNGSAYYGKDVDTRVDNKVSFVGGIVGKMADGGTISDCSHTKRQIRNQNFNNIHSLDGGAFCGGIVGALVGSSEHPGSITSVTVSDMDDGKYCAYGKRGDNGGIAGYVSYTTIDGTSCSGDPYGTNGSAKVAGAVAWMVASTLQNFTFTGNVKNGADTSSMGGLVYTLDGSSEVKDCVFDGTMQYNGGVIAYTASSGAKITNCGVRGTKKGVDITINNSDILGTGTATITGTYAYPAE